MGGRRPHQIKMSDARALSWCGHFGARSSAPPTSRVMSALLHIAMPLSFSIASTPTLPCAGCGRSLTLPAMPPLARPCQLVARTACVQAVETADDGQWMDRPIVQLAALLGAFSLHIAFSGIHLKASLPSSLPALRWLPAAVDVSVEDLVGAATVGGALVLARRGGGGRDVRGIAANERGADADIADGGGGGGGAADAVDDGGSEERPWQLPPQSRYELFEVVVALLAAYLLSGTVSAACEVLLVGFVTIGLPLSNAAIRALQVLSSHTAWVWMASHVLGTRLRPFFPYPLGSGGRWYTLRWRSRWLGWALGGYLASVSTYNAVDALHERLLPPLPPGAMEETDSIVSTLVGPREPSQRTGVFALLLGCFAPCVTAPLFEEILYRGFLLPALLRFLPYRLALLAQARSPLISADLP